MVTKASRVKDGPAARLAGTLYGRADQSVRTFGDVVVMTVDALRYLVSDIARGRFPWKEFFTQCWFIVSVAMLPMILVAIPFGVIISVQVGSLAQQVGATSFIGAANGLGMLKQGAPMVTALMMAGAVGSAIAADLGARTIREEIDALEVMGLSPIRRIVAPRLLATVVMGMFLCGVVAFSGVLTGYAFNVIAQSGTPGSFVASFAAFAQPADLVLAVFKSMLFGFIVGAVACNKGLSAKGGPRGVADAVNASVVLSIVLLFVVNVVITQLYAMVFPQRAG